MTTLFISSLKAFCDKRKIYIARLVLIDSPKTYDIML